MTPAVFDDLAVELAALNGLPLETARQYTSLVGDTPELADDGKVIVTDRTGKVLAHVEWPDEEE